MCVIAQDLIFRSSSDSIQAQVLTIGTTEITYRKWNNLEGPIYTISINEVAAIRYANGTWDTFPDKNTNENSPKVAATSSFLLSRKGNKYYFENNEMNKRETLQWLETQNCPAAYEKFLSGYRTANLGWGIMATGVSFDLIGTIIAFAAHNQQLGYVFMGMGGALEVSCIPTLIVGYCKMHNTVDEYNDSCGRTADAKPYWSIQAGYNGIGVAYNF